MTNRSSRLTLLCQLATAFAVGLSIGAGSLAGQTIERLPLGTEQRSAVSQVVALEAEQIPAQVTVEIRVLAVDKATRDAIYEGIGLDKLETQRLTSPLWNPQKPLRRRGNHKL